MKLIKFDSSISGTRKGEMRITFGAKGVINISKTAAEAMNIKTEDKVALSQDEDEPSDWYLHKDKEGFIVRQSTGGGSFMFNSSALKNTFCSAFELEENDTHKFKIGEEPVKLNKIDYWLLLTGTK